MYRCNIKFQDGKRMNILLKDGNFEYTLKFLAFRFGMLGYDEIKSVRIKFIGE